MEHVAPETVFYVPPLIRNANEVYKQAFAAVQVHRGGIFWQPRTFPTDPELISIGENVMLASGVLFINHDIVPAMLNKKYKTRGFQSKRGCISIGDNVMIGAGTIILPDVRIGSNVVIGAGSIVCKDIPDNSVAAGVPCRVVGEFDKLVEKYKGVKKLSAEELWDEFYKRNK